MSESYVLDATAILCLVNGEKGARMVEDVLAGSLVSAVNLSEVIAKLAEIGLDGTSAKRLLGSLPMTVCAFDADAAYAAGSLRSSTRAFGLSFADRACLALAKARNLPALTTDLAWTGVAGEIGVRIELVR